MSQVQHLLFVQGMIQESPAHQLGSDTLTSGIPSYIEAKMVVLALPSLTGGGSVEL